MRQTLGFIAVWCGATVLAASVTWFGVRDVLRSQVFDDVRVESLNAALSRMEAESVPLGTPTGPATLPAPPSAQPTPGRRAPTPTARHSTLSPRVTGSPQDDHKVLAHSRNSTTPGSSRSTIAALKPARTAAALPGPVRTSTAPSPSAQMAANDRTRVVTVKNGSVSFTIDAGVCRLVAATPNPGFEAQVSQADGWVRVDLVQGQHGSAVYCVGKESRTDVWEY
ncbi:hypothetical protein AB0395_31495 [Streptosporangium sp. NPDC051023]|uniref:hypothetical protein n=1 Tax=Streptosporangium sp. NPDC051023 TaxID=3155410 RepID=UPI00344EF69D